MSKEALTYNSNEYPQAHVRTIESNGNASATNFENETTSVPLERSEGMEDCQNEATTAFDSQGRNTNVLESTKRFFQLECHRLAASASTPPESQPNITTDVWFEKAITTLCQDGSYSTPLSFLSHISPLSQSITSLSKENNNTSPLPMFHVQLSINRFLTSSIVTSSKAIKSSHQRIKLLYQDYEEPPKHLEYLENKNSVSIELLAFCDGCSDKPIQKCVGAITFLSFPNNRITGIMSMRVKMAVLDELDSNISKYCRYEDLLSFLLSIMKILHKGLHLDTTDKLNDVHSYLFLKDKNSLLWQTLELFGFQLWENPEYFFDDEHGPAITERMKDGGHMFVWSGMELYLIQKC